MGGMLGKNKKTRKQESNKTQKLNQKITVNCNFLSKYNWK